jgi:hypothetical protein
MISITVKTHIRYCFIMRWHWRSTIGQASWSNVTYHAIGGWWMDQIHVSHANDHGLDLNRYMECAWYYIVTMCVYIWFWEFTSTLIFVCSMSHTNAVVIYFVSLNTNIIYSYKLTIYPGHQLMPSDIGDQSFCLIQWQLTMIWLISLSSLFLTITED